MNLFLRGMVISNSLIRLAHSWNPLTKDQNKFNILPYLIYNIV